MPARFCGHIELDEGSGLTVRTVDGREVFILYEDGELTVSDENRVTEPDGVAHLYKETGWYIPGKRHPEAAGTPPQPPPPDSV